MFQFIADQFNKRNISEPVGIAILLVIGFALPFTAMVLVTPIVVELLK